MSDTLHIVCPHCHTTNRVRTDQLGSAPDCGSCKKALFTGHSTALDEAAFDRHIQRNQIPVLVDGDLVLSETAAILLHLTDTHPQAGLAPAVGTHERAHFYKWLVWLSSTPQSMLMHYYYADRMVSAGNAAGAAVGAGEGAFGQGIGWLS